MKVELPKSENDRPELGRVGIIAAVGFGIGMIWPWLAGVKLVPNPPRDDSAEAPQAATSPSAAPSGATPVPAGPEAIAPKQPRRTERQSVNIGEPLTVSCRDEKGDKVKECDKIDFDRVAKGHLEKLATCAAAEGAAKTLSIGFDIDFQKNAVVKVSEGKSTTFPKDKAKALLTCAEKEFAGVKLDGVDHENSRYSIYYLAEFVPAGTVIDKTSGESGGEEETEASGLATVGWESALVRDEPDEGAVRARLGYGTRVVVTAKRGKWYRVKYDAKGSEGWVHKNAIGL